MTAGWAARKTTSRKPKAARKAAAMQACFEWMPIRDPDPLREHEAIFRSFELGDLATLAMVETRLLARDEQAAPKGELPAREQAAALLAVRDAPGRELLGDGQREWLQDVLAASVGAGKPWQILGNQVVMAKVAGPDLQASLGDEAFEAMRRQMPEPYRAQIDRALASYRAGVPFNLDSWDGYPHARERLYRSSKAPGRGPSSFTETATPLGRTICTMPMAVRRRRKSAARRSPAPHVAPSSQACATISQRPPRSGNIATRTARDTRCWRSLRRRRGPTTSLSLL